MGRLLKIAALACAALLLLISTAIGVLTWGVDPNDFKPEIEALVAEHTGRVLTISGDLKLSVFPWLGFSTEKLSLSNPSLFAEKPFLEIESSNIKVKLLPLLAKEIELSRIIFKGLKLNLEKNSQGDNNWDDLIASEQPGDKNRLPVFAALAISGVTLQGAQVVWDDQQSGQHSEIRAITLTTDSLAFNEPIGIELVFTLQNKFPDFIENIVFTTDMVVNKQLDIIQFDKVSIQSATEQENLPGGQLFASLTTDIRLNFREQELSLSDFQLSSGDVLIKAELKGNYLNDALRVTGPVKIVEFSPRKWMRQLQMDVPPMQDSSAFDRLAVQFELNATAHGAGIEQLSIDFDETSINGSAKINNYTEPVISMTLHGDVIDADRYFSNQSSAMPVVSPAAAMVAAVNQVPMATLRKLNINGRVSFDTLIINKLKLQDTHLQFKAENGIVNSRQTVKKIYRGTYSGDSTIDVHNNIPEIALHEEFSNVQLGPLLRDVQGKARMTGRINAATRLQGRGGSGRALRSSLKGSVKVEFTDGLILGFNLQKIIDEAKSFIGGSAKSSANANDQTEYDVIKASAKVVDGLITTNDLFAKSSTLRINGKGSADLPNEKLDYKVTANLITKEATPSEPEKIAGIPVIIDIGGTFAKPSYVLNVKEMIPEKTKQKLYDKIDKELGPGVSDILRRFL